MTPTLTLTRPDDWHLHLRDGAALAAVLPDTARQFARAIVMPNLKPPVTTLALAQAYREAIAKLGVVFDKQDAHVSILSVGNQPAGGGNP